MSTSTDVHSQNIRQSHAAAIIPDISDAATATADGSKALRATSPGTSLPESDGASSHESLKLWPISDLHLANAEGWSAGNIPEADVTIVAGNVCEGVIDAVTWLSAHIRPDTLFITPVDASTLINLAGFVTSVPGGGPDRRRVISLIVAFDVARFEWIRTLSRFYRLAPILTQPANECPIE